MKEVYIVKTERHKESKIWAIFANESDAEKCRDFLMEKIDPYVIIQEENVLDNINDYFGL